MGGSKFLSALASVGLVLSVVLLVSSNVVVGNEHSLRVQDLIQTFTSDSRIRALTTQEFVQKVAVTVAAQFDDPTGGAAEEFLTGKCPTQLAAIGEDFSTATPEQLVALITCVVDALVALVEPCLENFPGVWDPIHCTLEFIFSEELLLALVSASETEDTSELENLGNDLLTILEPQTMTAESCVAVFGSAAAPKFPACLSLFGSGDVKGFVNSLNSGFKDRGNDCKQMREVLALDQIDFQAELGIDLSQFDAAFLDSQLLGFNSNFGQCAKFDGGALGDSLNAEFNSPANRNVVGLLANFAMIAALIKYLLA